MNAAISVTIPYAQLLAEITRLTKEPYLNQSDVPARPTWSQADARELRAAADRIDESFRLYASNRGA